MPRPDAAPGFARIIRALWPDAPPMKQEHRFHPVRRWRFDIAFPSAMAAVEVHGGGWIRGGHHRQGGFIRDCEKLRAAQMAGWKVLPYTTDEIRRDPAGCVEEIKTLVQARMLR